jgi:FdhE protein
MRGAVGNHPGPWSVHIERARQLAATEAGSRELLTFYAALLDAQRAVHEGLSSGPERATGVLERDLPALRALLPALLDVVAAAGPESLARDARELSRAGDRALDPLLLEYWRTLSAGSNAGGGAAAFFAKASLQPYARWLVESGIPIVRDRSHDANRCPTCGGAPQVSVIQATGSEGARRSLLCALCLSAWPFRRLVCAACGEEDDRQIAYYHSDACAHVRLETCATCRRYLKTVDLTVLGLADPLVDELAAGALDAWARAHDYVKIELNLVGL